MEVRRDLRDIEEEEPLFSVIDEFESSLKFVDQPGQWTDCTPPAVRKQKQQEWAKLEKRLNADKKDE